MRRAPLSPRLDRLTPEQKARNSSFAPPIAREAKVAIRAAIKPVSDKRAKENRVRAKVLAELKARYPMCQRCGVRRSQDGHELKRRSAAGSITDENNIRMVCRPCHDWIGTHPVEAIEEGFARSRYA